MRAELSERAGLLFRTLASSTMGALPPSEINANLWEAFASLDPEDPPFPHPACEQPRARALLALDSAERELGMHGFIGYRQDPVTSQKLLHLTEAGLAVAADAGLRTPTTDEGSV